MDENNWWALETLVDNETLTAEAKRMPKAGLDAIRAEMKLE